ncbi:MAG: hypothetical protein U0744_12305 [Gemmataceae bacterium]
MRPLVLASLVAVCGIQSTLLLRPHKDAFDQPPKIRVVEDALDQLSRIVRDRSLKTIHDQVDFVIWLVHDHSVHCVDAWHNDYGEDERFVMSGILHGFRGDKSQFPHLSCGPRSLAVFRILHRIGIESRLVSLNTGRTGDLLGHTLLEVRNSETNRWEAADPTWAVHYWDSEQKRRASVLDLQFGNLKRIVPSGSRGNLRGWNAAFPISLNSNGAVVDTMADVLHLDYFGAALYGAHQTQRPGVMVVNTNRFDVKQTFPATYGKSFREWADSAYGNIEWVFESEMSDRVRACLCDEIGTVQRPALSASGN